MDFIKRLIKLAMEYQDTLDDETPPPLDPALAGDATQPATAIPPENIPPAAQPDPEPDPEPEAPVEPAMFQSNRQASLKGECVTDTFLTLQPHRPSFFDKN